MRSRYTAFAEHDLAWIRETLHPKLLADHDEEAIKKWSVKSEWLGLEITAVEEGLEGDDEGVVEFIARYKVDGRVIAHRERATFAREEGRWVFLDSADPAPTTFRRDAPKLGRNDPCACGSGKKAKKCCGIA